MQTRFSAFVFPNAFILWKKMMFFARSENSNLLLRRVEWKTGEKKYHRARIETKSGSALMKNLLLLLFKSTRRVSRRKISAIFVHLSKFDENFHI